MGQTMARLDALDVQLDGLQAVPGADSVTVGRSKCGSDSGDIFQPATTRTWKVRQNENWIAADTVADQLRTRGWIGPTEHDQFGNYELAMDREGWSARVLVTPLDNDTVYLRAQVVGAAPCRGVPR